MIRTQIQLTEDQAKRLKQLAAEEDRSMADLVRESVGDYLTSRQDASISEEQKRRFLAAAGSFSGDASDVAINHDKYLAEAFYDWK